MLKLKLDFKPDYKALLKHVDDSAARVGKRFGAFVMRTARRSIRRPKKDGSSSEPGKPPRAQTRTLKSSILFEYDPLQRSVFIGPTLLPGRIGKGAPEALEKGGRSTRIVKQDGRKKRIKQSIKPRPFMVPALEKELPNLENMWKDQIKG